jgi:hypothetical protein|tara:strand:+ start:1728 stop:2651 length:924 start_codon:yes stop_codon:yes gene_type:complete
MSIKQTGGVFGRNPTFNDVTIDGTLTFNGDIDIDSDLKVSGDLDVTGASNLNGPVTINGLGVDADFRVEGDTDANLIWADASRDKVGIGHNWGNDANSKLRVQGPYLSSFSTSSISAISATNGGAVSTWIGGVGYSYGYIQAIQDDGSNNLKQLHLNPLGGDVQVPNGNLIIGTSGKGIDFSATAGTGTSELLDDYEEGTWTPVVAAGAISGTSITFTGKYTKIGNSVTVWFQASNSTGDIQISSYAIVSGLPFTGTATGTGSIITEDIDIYARQGFCAASAASLLLSAAGSASGTVKLTSSVTYQV